MWFNNSRDKEVEVFKILNGYENIDRNVFFSLKKDSRTRGNEVSKGSVYIGYQEVLILTEVGR